MQVEILSRGGSNNSLIWVRFLKQAKQAIRDQSLFMAGGGGGKSEGGHRKFLRFREWALK